MKTVMGIKVMIELDKNGWTGKGGIVDKDDDWFGKGDENGWTGKGGIVDEDDDWFGKGVL
ncbi:12554_t:CDS:2, partial [Entrophospora sp. SA101]